MQLPTHISKNWTLLKVSRKLTLSNSYGLCSIGGQGGACTLCLTQSVHSQRECYSNPSTSKVAKESNSYCHLVFLLQFIVTLASFYRSNSWERCFWVGCKAWIMRLSRWQTLRYSWNTLLRAVANNCVNLREVGTHCWFSGPLLPPWRDSRTHRCRDFGMEVTPRIPWFYPI